MIALIVIDQQTGIDYPRLGARNNPGAEARMLDLLARWRKLSWPVFHIKHRSRETDSVFWPEQAGFNFKNDFLPRDGEFIIEKSVPCAFINNALAESLTKLNVNTIAIVGASTNNSVEATARTGGNLGFQVYVVEDACFTFAKADYFGRSRTATEVHAMSLANLNGEYARVLSHQRLIALIEPSN